MGIEDLVAATPSPGTRASLSADLRALGIREGDVLLVHSSLSALGWVCGGAATLLHALGDALGANGTLVVPTHCPEGGDPAHWRNPPVPTEWIETLRAERPAFDPARTPSGNMGAVPELFRAWPDVLRSDHPVGSFAARGPLAESITAEHDLADVFGDTSPVGALYRHDARVLLLGVGHDSNTSLHLGEFRASWPSKATIREGSRVLVDGESRWVTYDMLRWDSDDFPQLGAAFEHQCTHTAGPVGTGTGRLYSQRALVDFAATWIAANRL